MNYFGEKKMKRPVRLRRHQSRGGDSDETKKSQKLFQEAQKVIPGGVNQPGQGFSGRRP